MHRLLVLLVFLLSGAAGLVYQVVWMRQLTLVLGVTHQAVSTVLAVFMGGLALGSWLLGRIGDRTRSPLRVYGWLELGIALFGALSLPVLRALPGTYAELRDWSGAMFPFVRFGLVSLVLLGPTTLMGATLPVLIKGICRTPARVARDSGLLYGINTFGAVLGTIAAGFFLVEHLGILATSYVAVGLNVAAAVAAFLLARGAEEPASEPSPAVSPDVGPAVTRREQPVDRGTERAVLLAFGISGFLALGFEVLWTRYLVYVVGENSVYAFATMLAAFLIGIALGSFIAAFVADRARNRVVLLGVVLTLMGAASAATVTLMGPLSDSTEIRMGFEGFWGGTAARFLKCLAVLIVPTTLSGSTFAIVARIYARDLASLGADVGRAYAINTVGAILGALAGGFVVLPHLGLVNGILTLAAVDVVVGGWLLLRRTGGHAAVRPAIATGAVAAAAFVSVAWSESPSEILARRTEGEIIYYADGPESSVAVERIESGEISILVDGEGQAGTDIEGQIHLRLLGHLPALFHPDPKRGLVVAYGAGITTGCLAQHPLERVDLVELNPKVIYGASAFFAPYNHDPVPYARPGNEHLREDALVQVHIDDGRNFLLASDERWDVITTDPVDPDDRGVTSLYCVEYYELVREHLTPGGFACQWITNGYGDEAYNMLMRSFQEVFPYTAIWNAAYTTVAVGSAEPPRVSLEDLRRKFEIPEVRDSLAHVGIDDAESLLAMMFSGPELTRELIWSGDPERDVLNTDDRPRIEYFRRPEDDGEWDGGTWRRLVESRTKDYSDWLRDFDADDAAACAPAVKWMDLHYEPQHERWARMDARARERGRSGESGGAPSGDEVRAAEDDDPDPAFLRRAAEVEERAVRDLERRIAILAGDGARVLRVLSGVDQPEPPEGVEAESLERYSQAMERGLASFQVDDFATALTAFREALDAAPDAHRAGLLAAACLYRLGDEIGALRAVLVIEARVRLAYGYGRSNVRAAMSAVFRQMASGEVDAEAIGRELLALMPSAEERPLRPEHMPWWWWDEDDYDYEEGDDGAEARPPSPRPTEAQAGDVDAWRLWWRDARFQLVPADGRFDWREAPEER